MPNLKQLTCHVEWSTSNLPLQEFQTSYADGFVETYIAVPAIPTPFSVHLRSRGYIAPGLAMFVYMDGEYQCNRNRTNLKIPDGTSMKKQTEVEFLVRQKEEITGDGSFRGKQWRFGTLNIGLSILSLLVIDRNSSLMIIHSVNVRRPCTTSRPSEC